MSDTATSTDAAAATTDAAASTTTDTQATTASTATAQTDAASTAAPKVEDLPDWAQKRIADLAKEAGDSRINAKKAAAEEARQTLAQEIAKILNPEATDKVDPAKLTEQLTTTQAQARSAALELAIFKAAGPAGANAAALTDRRSFMDAVKDLDPSAEDFATKIGEAITKAITADTTLKQAGRAPSASGRENTGGSGEAGQITEEQLQTMTAEQIVEAQEKGLLKHLLGG